jgi:NAD(P)-dependent dehydrogenase (short-subunit alcohol dehydrogenase family)
VLYQSFADLLSASKADGGAAKFVTISSVIGQITDSGPWVYNAYGLSKAGANFFAKKLNQEVSDVISFPIQ